MWHSLSYFSYCLGCCFFVIVFLCRDLYNRCDISFYDKNSSSDPGFTLTLSQRMTYHEVSDSIIEGGVCSGRGSWKEWGGESKM